MDLYNVTAQIEAVVINTMDGLFLEPMKEALETVSNAESQVHVQEWVHTDTNSLSSFVALMVVHEEYSGDYFEEIDFLEELFNAVALSVGPTNAAQKREKILICHASSKEFIRTFCELHKLEEERMLDCEGDSLTLWSMWIVNRRHINLRVKRLLNPTIS